MGRRRSAGSWMWLFHSVYVRLWALEMYVFLPLCSTHYSTRRDKWCDEDILHSLHDALGSSTPSLPITLARKVSCVTIKVGPATNQRRWSILFRLLALALRKPPNVGEDEEVCQRGRSIWPHRAVKQEGIADTIRLRWPLVVLCHALWQAGDGIYKRSTAVRLNMANVQVRFHHETTLRSLICHQLCSRFQERHLRPRDGQAADTSEAI